MMVFDACELSHLRCPGRVAQRAIRDLYVSMMGFHACGKDPGSRAAMAALGRESGEGFGATLTCHVQLRWP